MNTTHSMTQWIPAGGRNRDLRHICRGLILLVASFVCAAAAIGQPTSIEQQIGRELLAMAKADQSVRSADVGSMSQQERREHFAAAADGDRQRASRLKEIIEAYGWPDPQRFGVGAGEAAFIIIQHADHDTEFQARCLPLLEKAAERGQVSLKAVAFLTDRLRVKQGQPQVYGTQYQPARDNSGATVMAKNGMPMYELPLVEDIDRLDERRAAVGLGPWLDYERQMAELQAREPAQSPRSLRTEEDHASDTSPQAQAAPQAVPPHEDPMKFLEKVSHQYTILPVLTDVISTSFVMEGRSDATSTIKVRIKDDDAEATGIVPPTSLDIFLIDDTLLLGLVGAPGMIVAETDERPLACAEEHLGIAFAYLPPQMWMRWTEGTGRAGEWFTFGMLEDCEMVGFSDLEIDGARMHEVYFEGTAPLLGGRPGKGVARFDADSLLLTQVVIDGGTDREAPTFSFEARFNPRTPADLESPIELELPDGTPRYSDFMDMLTTALSAKPTIAIGIPAPVFQLSDQRGKEHSLEDYRGKFVILDWWGLWCAPCRRILPHMQDLHDQYAADDRVAILLMNVRDDAEDVQAYFDEHGYTFTSLDNADALVEAYGIRGFPSVILLGPDGAVLHAAAGSSKEVEQALQRALAQHESQQTGP